MNGKNKYILIAAVVVIITIGYYAFDSVHENGAAVSASGNSASVSSEPSPAGSADSETDDSGHYDYTEASRHIGERASVTGTIIDTYQSQKGSVFLDFCSSYKNCPFSAIISSTAVKSFPDLDQYKGQKVTLTGVIKSYQGKVEMFLDDPSQLVEG